MSKFCIPFLLLILFALTGVQVKNLQHDIFLGLKNNNSKAIVKCFSSSVSLSLHNQSRMCNKFQAELILTNFFQNNKVQKVKVVSSDVNKPNRSYIVYEVATEKGVFQVLVKFTDNKGEPTVVEFIIC